MYLYMSCPFACSFQSFFLFPLSSPLIRYSSTHSFSLPEPQNEALLQRLPAPRVAVEYYVVGDLYLFDEFQTSRRAYSRRPVIRSLYDVFCAIRDDESEHVKTINAVSLTLPPTHPPTHPMHPAPHSKRLLFLLPTHPPTRSLSFSFPPTHPSTHLQCQVADSLIISPNAAAANAGWAEEVEEEEEEEIE